MAILERTFTSSLSGHPSARRVSVFFAATMCAVMCLAGLGCSTAQRDATSAIIAIDDFGDTLRLANAPSRIVSLTPASTELLFALGAGQRLVGRTHWDVWPDSATLVHDVGDGIRPNVEAILARDPDLVLLYASQENRTAATLLRNAGVPTLSLKVDLPTQFVNLTMILGAALRDTLKARQVSDSVMQTLQRVRDLTRNVQRPTVFWIAELEPLIAIGGGSFLSELMATAGAVNAYEDIAAPSAPISLEDVLRRNPDVIIAAPRTTGEVRSRRRWSAVRAVSTGRVLEGDSYTMGRPSVRMGEAAVTLARMLHPELFR